MSLTGTVQRFEDLPAGAATGAVYRIAGGTDTSFVPYYVQRSAEGVWDETVAPGLNNRIDPRTMPHALIRNADGTFTFSPFVWNERVVGDAESNPDPGFIGRRIQKALVYQNRLTLLYDENAIMSGAGEFGRFYRLTVLDYIDSDPIDVAATTSKVSILRDAVPFSDGVMLFADQTQFALSNGESGLSATSLAIRPVTHYEASRRASPVPLGSEVYFTADNAGYASVFEYTRSPDSDVTTAANITAHVPRYIPSGVHKLIPAGDLNTLFVLTDGDPSAIFVYQFYWVDGNTKAQSAWHRWSLSPEDTILSGGYTSGVLTLVISRPTGVYLERIRLGSDEAGDIVDRFPYLDRRQELAGVYDAANDRTVFTFPEAPAEPLRVSLVRPAGWPGNLGETILPIGGWLSPTEVCAAGDQTAMPVYAGYRYTARWRLSQPYLRRPDGTAVVSGRLQLRTLRLSYRTTASFQAAVHPYGEGVTDPLRFTFSGLVLGSGALNQRPSANGSLPVGIAANAGQAAIDIINDDPYGCSFQSAEWETFFWARARP